MQARHVADSVHGLDTSPAVVDTVPDAPSRSDSRDQASFHVCAGRNGSQSAVSDIKTGNEVFVGDFSARWITIDARSFGVAVPRDVCGNLGHCLGGSKS